MSSLEIRLVECDAQTPVGRRIVALGSRTTLVVSIAHARWAVRVRDADGTVIAQRELGAEQIANDKIELTVGAHHFNAWSRFVELTIETRDEREGHLRSDGRGEADWRAIDTLVVRGARAASVTKVAAVLCVALCALWMFAPAASRLRRAIDFATMGCAALPLLLALGASRRTRPREAVVALVIACVSTVISLRATVTIHNTRDPELRGVVIERGVTRWAPSEVRSSDARLIVRNVAFELGPRCARDAQRRPTFFERYSRAYELTSLSGVVDIDRRAVDMLHLRRAASCGAGDDPDARCCLSTLATQVFAPEPQWRPDGESGVASAHVYVRDNDAIRRGKIALAPTVSQVMGVSSWELWDERQPSVVLSWAEPRGATRFAPTLLGMHLRATLRHFDSTARTVRCSGDATSIWSAEFPSGTIDHVAAGALDVDVTDGRADACGPFWSSSDKHRLSLRLERSNSARLRWHPKWRAFSLRLHAAWTDVSLVADGRELGVASTREGWDGARELVAVRVGPELGAVRTIAAVLDVRGAAPLWRGAEASDLVFFVVDPEARLREMMSRVPVRNPGTRVLVTTADADRPREALVWQSAEGWRLDAGLITSGPRLR